jgi:hypothetical protein
LKEFQHTKATAGDTLNLLGSINTALAAKGEKPLKQEMLKDIFNTFWPSLDNDLKGAIAKNQAAKPRREGAGHGRGDS